MAVQDGESYDAFFAKTINHDGQLMDIDSPDPTMTVLTPESSKSRADYQDGAGGDIDECLQDDDAESPWFSVLEESQPQSVLFSQISQCAPPYGLQEEVLSGYLYDTSSMSHVDALQQSLLESSIATTVPDDMTVEELEESWTFEPAQTTLLASSTDNMYTGTQQAFIPQYYALPIRNQSRAIQSHSQIPPQYLVQNSTMTANQPFMDPQPTMYHTQVADSRHLNQQLAQPQYAQWSSPAQTSTFGHIVQTQTITYWPNPAPATTPAMAPAMPLHHSPEHAMLLQANGMLAAAPYAVNPQHQQLAMPASRPHPSNNLSETQTAFAMMRMQPQTLQAVQQQQFQSLSPTATAPFNPNMVNATTPGQSLANPQAAQIAHSQPSHASQTSPVRQQSSSGTSTVSSNQSTSLAPSRSTSQQLHRSRRTQQALPSRARGLPLCREHAGIASAALKPLVPKFGPSKPPTMKEVNKGGRYKALLEHVAENAKEMRIEGGCWKCVILRVACDKKGENGQCTRCERARKNNPAAPPCCRIKLPMLIHKFLPDSMTEIHQKKFIAEAIGNEVDSWREKNSFDIYLSLGWGIPLRRTVCEIVPNNPQSTVQYQYFQNPKTRLMERVEKFSPPLAIKKVDPGPNVFDEYLDSLCVEEHLLDFCEMCYASESRHEKFQEELLRLLCKLYLAHNETIEPGSKSKYDMKELLGSVLRMLILTYIMGHSLTIVESNLPSVFERVGFVPKTKQKQISPRLANRQLKHFFCELRQRIYETMLRQMQNVFAAGVNKTESWMYMFCSMLGFAMVLEEIQGSMQIHADASARNDGVDWDQSQAKARKECEAVDEGFGMMVQLFQNKYRCKTWTRPGPFGNQTPQPTHAADFEFLVELRKLVDEKREYLEWRRDIPLGHEYQCHYTSRLVARFLLPFSGLPA